MAKTGARRTDPLALDTGVKPGAVAGSPTNNGLPSGAAAGASLGSFLDPKEIAARAGNQALGKQPGTAACANGGRGNGQSTSRGNGPTPGVYDGLQGDVKNLQPSIDKWNAAHADKGLKMHAFSGRGSRSASGSKHPSGNAVDVVIVDKNGCAFDNLYNGDAPAFRAYESFASQVCQDFNGRVGWGGNFGGTWWNDSMHFQNGGPVGQNGRVCEGKKNPTVPNNSDPGNTRYDGPATCQEANGGQGESRGQGSDDSGGGGGCGEGSSGCRPVSSSAPAAASSMAAGQGLAANPVMGAALGAFGSGGTNLMAAAQGAAQQAIGQALGGGIIPNGAGSLLSGGGIGSFLSGGLTSPLSQITSQVGGLVQGLGGGILPSLTGVIPAVLQGGNLTGLMTGAIQNQISGLIGAGLPNLGGFGQVFSSALGAAAGGADLKGALMGSVSQIFGNATGISPSMLPGFDITSKLGSLGVTDAIGLEGISDNLNFTNTKLTQSLAKKRNLTLPFNEALSEAFDKPRFDGFTTMYNDYNSMITKGFGNLSNDLRSLGIDLIRLGKLGDLTDLFNIGTPGQLTRQVIENGFGISSGITLKLVENRLKLDELHKEENAELLVSMLADINDPDLIRDMKLKFEIHDEVAIENLADLLDPEVIFAESYEYNNFQDLRDIALTLSICGGAGRLRTLSELGFVIASLETAELFTELLEEKQPIRVDEFAQLSNDMPTDSYFSKSGPTVADFIGSLAGYVHNDTLPQMDILLQELYDDPVTDDFYDLMELLTDTLSNPTIVTVLGVDYVQVPNISLYTFGNYLTLDEAITDIVAAIEDELDLIKGLAESDPDLDAIISELEALHNNSAEFLAHEQRMRSKYGINFGDPEVINNFRGDGTTTNFPIYGTLTSGLQVFISGVQQIKGSSYTYNSNSQQVVFSTAPAAGTNITIRYESEVTKPESRITDIWQLANSLESLALETGHGQPADFLSRLVTNDYHGQRIMSLMMESRNNQRLSNYGISCPAFSQVMTDGSDMDKTVNFIDHTGIWTSNPTRASEIWVQNAAERPYQSYILDRYKARRSEIQEDLDILMQNLTRQMIFYNDGNIAVSGMMAEIYQDLRGNDVYSRDSNDLILNYSDDLPFEGYLLGPYKEIVSAITRKENYKNDVFDAQLSDATAEYLKSIDVDIGRLVTVLQRVLTANGVAYLGIGEGDFQSIFGIQSVSKAILSNMANDY